MGDPPPGDRFFDHRELIFRLVRSLFHRDFIIIIMVEARVLDEYS